MEGFIMSDISLIFSLHLKNSKVNIDTLKESI